MQLVEVAVENEMDLTLAYKKSIKAAGLLGLSTSTQTAFATAVSEVCREIIDKTHDGLASIEVHTAGGRYSLAAVISYKECTPPGNLHGGLEYARKLVPAFNATATNGSGKIELKLSIPGSARVDPAKVLTVKDYFKNIEPATPYEEVRLQNLQLFIINEQAEVALKHLEYLDEQKNEFLSVASHELKTPLTILKAYTQLALKSDCSPKTLEHLKQVDKQAQKMQTLIQQLLDVSKLGSGKTDYHKEDVEFDSYLNNVLQMMPQLVPGYELIISLGTKQTIHIDKLRIEQVISNIIGNAAKYSPLRMQIKICTKTLPNGELLFSVQDWGIGMSEEELEKVFDKFYRVQQVTNRFTGLGVGLYVSSQIITDHGGKIWVESTKGHGSTFCFTLPPAPVNR